MNSRRNGLRKRAGERGSRNRSWVRNRRFLRTELLEERALLAGNGFSNFETFSANAHSGGYIPLNVEPSPPFISRGIRGHCTILGFNQAICSQTIRGSTGSGDSFKFLAANSPSIGFDKPTSVVSRTESANRVNVRFREDNGPGSATFSYTFENFGLPKEGGGTETVRLYTSMTVSGTLGRYTATILGPQSPRLNVTAMHSERNLNSDQFGPFLYSVPLENEFNFDFERQCVACGFV